MLFTVHVVWFLKRETTLEKPLLILDQSFPAEMVD